MSDKMIIGFDRIEIKPENILSMAVYQEGTEALSITAPYEKKTSYHGKSYKLEGLTREYADDLLSGRAYLEFKIKALNFNEPTLNNRIYKRDEVLNSLNDPTVIRGLDNGGIPAEVEHPYQELKPGSMENGQGGQMSPEARMALMNKLNRLCHIDYRNSPHFLCGFEIEGDELILTIKTSINNKQIINDILNGRMPTFSIRTIAKFMPNTAGYMEAHQLKFITTDYVWNPAVVDSRAREDVKLKFSYKPEIIDLKLLSQKTGTEADESTVEYLKSLIPEGYDLGVLPELGAESLNYMTLIPKGNTKQKSFKESYGSYRKSIFGI